MDTFATFPIVIEMPLRLDDAGAIRIGNTRVLLDTIVTAFNMGTPPEKIADQFDAVSLTQIYQVIGYYLANKEAADAYLAKREAEAEALRLRYEAEFPQSTKEALLKRIAERKANTNQP